MIIYKATNLVNGKIYIGLTIKTLKVRKIQHISGSRNNSNLAFHRALRKYGENNFVWETIDSAKTEEELKEKEIYWIAYYNCCVFADNSNGYNLSSGGDGTSGYKQTDAQKQKNSDIRKKKGLAKGSKNIKAKLTENEVLQIKELIKEGLSLRDIADKFGVCQDSIGRIRNGKTWNHVGEDLSNNKHSNKGSSKLTESEVREIKLLLKDGKMTQNEIAEIYGVKRVTITNIKTGKSWSNIEVA